ncbi:PREDICTED: zona pellucida-binding protein 2 [Chaetura pelagica]|nr:PREDICTED: zona pellucida-binding protein 2 [Chaetura pelagica]
MRHNYIYGDSKHEVNVYVKVYSNSPVLVCMDLALSQKELIDPKYVWTGPNGNKLEEKKHVEVEGTGKLVLIDFKESMSGAYTCTLFHKILPTIRQEEREKAERYRFMVYAYREADHTYQGFAHFMTKTCELEANEEFFEKLKKMLNDLISDLTCHLSQSSYRCHHIRTPERGFHHELFVSFQVNPFAPGWEEVCHQGPSDCQDVTNMRVHKARDRIQEVFKKMTSVLEEFESVPSIHYVDKSFSVFPIDSCRPGFGKNNLTHRLCASCCVVCEPGTYSPNNDVTCQVCAKPEVRKYGARHC